MRATLGRGLIAGAAGTTALNWATYVDMAARGRPSSGTPSELVGTVLDRLDVKRPDDNRLSGLGALAGIKVGLLVGVGASVARAAGVRLPTAIAAGLIGGAAMAGSDVPIVALGISDPREWKPADWASDIVPHLAYGLVTHATLVALDPRRTPRGRVAAQAGKAFALGWASGGRTSFGPAALVLASHGSESRWARARSLGAVLASAGEVVVDKLPQTPSRLEPQVLGGRIVTGAGAAGALAHRDNQPLLVSAALGAAGAAAGSFAGNLWRRAAAKKVPDWQAAVGEDVATAAIAAWAVRPTSLVEQAI
jgi:uncharacterized membrane protein